MKDPGSGGWDPSTLCRPRGMGYGDLMRPAGLRRCAVKAIACI